MNHCVLGEPLSRHPALRRAAWMIASVALWIGALVLGNGCTLPTMELPNSLQQNTREYPVDGFSFSGLVSDTGSVGAYAISDRNDGWGTGYSTMRMGSVEITEAEGTYSFSMSLPRGNSWFVQCAVRGNRNQSFEWQGFEIASAAVSLFCSAQEDGEATWSLVLYAQNNEGLTGWLTSDENLTVREVRRITGAIVDMSSPAGYLFEREGEPLAAMNLANGRRLLVRADVEETLIDGFAMASAALAMFDDPRENMGSSR